MVGDTSNLVDLIRSHLPGDFSNRIFSLLGENREKAQAGVDAAVPGILSGMERTASTGDGAQRLSSAVDGADDSMFSRIGEMFGRQPTSDGSAGPLQSILGTGGLSELTGNIGQSSGLSGKSVITLLGFLAPIVLGVLKKVKRERGLDAAGLSSLLSSQRGNFAPGMTGVNRPQTPVEGGSYSREPLRDVSYKTPQSERVRTPSREGSSVGWVLPLLIFLGLILLWHWGSSRRTVHAGGEPGTIGSETGRLGTAGTMDALKKKYQSVIDQARNQGVQLTTLDQQNGKLVIKGTAPSLEAANKVWDEIKSINPSMDDIIADFPVAGMSGTYNP
jgi:hypothetical protein